MTQIASGLGLIQTAGPPKHLMQRLKANKPRLTGTSAGTRRTGRLNLSMVLGFIAL
jgi:hypothetical protein